MPGRDWAVNMNSADGGRILMDWYNDTLAPQMGWFDPSRLSIYNVHGPLNLTPLFSNNNPIPSNLRGFNTVPNSPMQPNPNGGDGSVTVDIFIGQGGGSGNIGPPGPAGDPGLPGEDGPDGADGSDVCTCAVRIICSTTYTNRAACRTSSIMVGNGNGVPDDCPCEGFRFEAWAESSIEITANHSSNSYFPPGFFGSPNPVDVATLDSFGPSDHAVGVRQSASSQVTYEEKVTLKRSESPLLVCGSETPGPVVAVGCIPDCSEFNELDFGQQASTSYKVVSEATRELTSTGYEDSASETITDVRCDDEVTTPGPTDADDHTTTIAPPHFCDGGPGQFAQSPLTTYPPLSFIVAPSCCDCASAGSDESLSVSRASELGELAFTPSRCIWDYADPMEPTSATSSGGAATVNVFVGYGPTTWYINVSGSYSFVDEIVVPGQPDDCDWDFINRCEWYGEFEWETSVTFLLEEAP